MDPLDLRMMAAAELSFSLAMPTESAGGMYLASPSRDEIWARRLFEAAVGGFYDVVLSSAGWTTRTEPHSSWPVEDGTPGLRKLMPAMEMDIVLDRRDAECRNRDRRIVIDTKFTSIVTSGRFRREVLRSGYLYQIYSYLRSQEMPSDPVSRRATGMLLHPAVDGDVYESGVIQGHEIRFATVNLAASSRAIRERLLSVVSEEGADSH
jgi:5-methylcytosine-specific restriction enzyme subunit McrC